MNEALEGHQPGEEAAVQYCYDILRQAQLAGEGVFAELIAQLDPLLLVLVNEPSEESARRVRSLILDWGLELHYRGIDQTEGGIVSADEEPLTADEFVARLRSRAAG